MSNGRKGDKYKPYVLWACILLDEKQNDSKSLLFAIEVQLYSLQSYNTTSTEKSVHNRMSIT